MGLDPDVVRAKPGGTFLRWQAYAQADAMVDDWRAAEADAAFQRKLEG